MARLRRGARLVVASNESALAGMARSARRAHSFVCSATNGSFIRINAWAGTLETLRRPIVLKGTGESNVNMNGDRKFRRTAM